MTAVDAPPARGLHAICELARLATCGECWSPPEVPCLRGDHGTKGYHVAKIARAYRRGLTSAADLTAVLDDVEVFGNSTVVYDGRAGAAP